MPLLQTIGSEPEHYQDAHLYVDFQRKTVLLDLERLKLTRKEYELIAMLVQNAGDIVAREDLLQRIWGYSNQIRTRTLDVHIRRLRRKLGQHADVYIETIFGIGYRFQPFRAHVQQRPMAPVYAVGA
jgi:two-component system alkaline phosphatase synthesis response regulator PhoP